MKTLLLTTLFLGACTASTAPAPVPDVHCVITSCYPHDSAPRYACDVPIGAEYTCDSPDVAISWAGDAHTAAWCTNGIRPTCDPGEMCLVFSTTLGTAEGLCQ